MTYLLDTCILSKLRKIHKHPDVVLERWAASHSQGQFFLSVLTIGEIQKGINKLSNGSYRRTLDDWLTGEVTQHFRERILPIDYQVAMKWGELNGSYQQQGISIPVTDGLIAATALVHGLTVVTDNLKDFSLVRELKLFSPWETSTIKESALNK